MLKISWTQRITNIWIRNKTGFNEEESFSATFHLLQKYMNVHTKLSTDCVNASSVDMFGTKLADI